MNTWVDVCRIGDVADVVKRKVYRFLARDYTKVGRDRSKEHILQSPKVLQQS